MKFYKKHSIFLVLILTLFFTLSISYAKSVSCDISNSVFRLHITANSDSAADQNLKLLVRDRILKESPSLFKDAVSASESAEIANKNLDKLTAIAQDEIRSQGFDYGVTARVGTFPFPTKSYGDISLPCGKYSALRIEIGEALGKNWWCVMYPPLCFTDGVLACDESSKIKLKNSLSNSEYELITKKNSANVPVEVRFKIVEIIQNIF